nr:DUF5906 domain-containing protein [Coleofasciculus sp. FACHB-129]
MSDSSLNLTPNEEVTQQVLNFFYQDKPWICLNGTLHEWNETHYEPRHDVSELRRISDFCNAYVIKTKNGDKYPYANAAKVKAVLEWVKIRLGVDPSLVNPPGLNCTNGVLEIRWEGATPKWELIPHEPAKYYTYPPLATYDPNADPQHCDRLLAVLDEPQREIFLRTIAASLDLQTVRKYKGRLVRGLLLKGHGSNGKDAAKEVTAAMYGYQGISSATVSDFAAYDSGRKFPIAQTEKALINWSSENANFAKLDKVQSLKAFITGDTLSAERKGRDEREFAPRAVALFNCNDTPNLQGSLEAITGRYGVLTFNKTFKINADPSKGELEADPRFKYDREFLQKEVLPAFLNKVLSALIDLMRDGIDYSCTRKALEDIQAENSHLFQFCQDTGLDYDPEGTLKAGEIWERLKHWYEENGTLTYSDSKKPIWTDQAKKGDRNVKGMNQVLARFHELFPKAKRVTVGKGNIGLKGISFSKISSEGEAVKADGEAMVRQMVRLEPLPDNDGEAVEAVSLPLEKIDEMQNGISLQRNEIFDPGGDQPQKLPRLPHPPDPVSDTASPTASPTASSTTSTASPAVEKQNFERFSTVALAKPFFVAYEWHGYIEDFRNNGKEALVRWEERAGKPGSQTDWYELSELRLIEWDGGTEMD